MSSDAKEAKEAPEEKKEEGDGALEAELAAKKKAKRKMMILIAVGGLVLVGGGVGAALVLTGSKAKDEAKTEETGHAEAEKKEEKGKAEVPTFYALGDILVNLNGEGKRPNYLKVKISLELADPADAPKMDILKPRIIDNFQVYLRELRVEDLRGSAGLYRLREALLLRVTEAAQPIRVRDVLFQEMLVQ